MSLSGIQKNYLSLICPRIKDKSKDQENVGWGEGAIGSQRDFHTKETARIEESSVRELSVKA